MTCVWCTVVLTPIGLTNAIMIHGSHHQATQTIPNFHQPSKFQDYSKQRYHTVSGLSLKTNSGRLFQVFRNQPQIVQRLHGQKSLQVWTCYCAKDKTNQYKTNPKSNKNGYVSTQVRMFRHNMTRRYKIKTNKNIRIKNTSLYHQLVVMFFWGILSNTSESVSSVLPVPLKLDKQATYCPTQRRKRLCTWPKNQPNRCQKKRVTWQIISTFDF